MKKRGDNYTYSFGLQWKQFSKTQLDSANGTTISRDRFIRITGWNQDRLKGKIVADFGCGMGRFAEIALMMNPRKLILIDYSEAVWIALKNLNHDHRVEAHQDSIMQLSSIPDESIDYGYCIGVLQHTPNPQKALQVIFKKIRPSGQLAIWAYKRNWKEFLHRMKGPLRIVTKRLPASFVLQIMPTWVDFWLPVSNFLRRISLASISKLLPIADYSDQLPLNQLQIREWAILDTFDMWTPTYDLPMTKLEVESALSHSGVKFKIEWNNQVPGITAVIIRL